MSGAITLKLTSLLIRTVSKPISNLIKTQTKQNEFFKQNFIRFGQFLNKIDLRLRNNNSSIKIRPLNDNKAIEIGSNFLSELFIFSIAASLILYESFKPKKSEKVQITNDFDILGKEIENLKLQNSTILQEINKLKALSVNTSNTDNSTMASKDSVMMKPPNQPSINGKSSESTKATSPDPN